MKKDDLGAKIELSPSSRAKCRSCGEKIEKNTKRIGIPSIFVSPSGNKHISYKYYHIGCVTGRYAQMALESDNVNLLTEEEKEIIKDKIDKKLVYKRKFSLRPTKPFIEVAKSARSKCQQCQEKISKDSFRVGKPVEVELPNGKTIISNKYYHLDCYFRQITNKSEEMGKLINESLDQGLLTQEQINRIQRIQREEKDTESLISTFLEVIGNEEFTFEEIFEKLKAFGISKTDLQKVLDNALLQGLIYEGKPGHYKKT